MTLHELLILKNNRGYTLKYISEKSGVPVVTLQKIFSGETKNPRPVTLRAIEQVFTESGSETAGKTYEYFQKSTVFTGVKETGSYHPTKKKDGEFTTKDFFALPEEVFYELIDGTFYDLGQPSLIHQEIVTSLAVMIKSNLTSKKKPCRLFVAPLAVQLLRDDKNMLVPDLLIVCDPDKLRSFGIYGAPDFVLEVLSPSTRRKDLTLKLSKYMDAGVREYWMVDPVKEVLIIYNFMEEELLPAIHPLNTSVPLAISQGEILIDLVPIGDAIREMKKLPE